MIGGDRGVIRKLINFQRSQDFEKFVQLVGEGDCSKVDLRHEELEGFCVSEDVAGDVVCSELGKMNLENSGVDGCVLNG